MDDEKCIRCDNCKQIFKKHLRMKPCEHVICDACAYSLDWQEISCPKCKKILEDIDCNPQIIKQILSTEVMCPNVNDQHIQVEFFMASEVTREFNAEFIDDAVFDMVERFNQNQFNQQSQNYVRRNSLSRRDQDIIDQIKGDNYKIEFFHYMPLIKEIDIPACPHRCLFKDLDQHLKHSCPHTPKQCQCCDIILPQDVIKIHQVSCQHQLLACPVCYQTDIKVKDYNLHVQQCLQLLYAAEQNIDQLPKKDQTDVDIELKVEALYQQMDLLSNKILMWDTLTQKEVFNFMQAFQQKERDRGIWAFFNVIYKKYLLLYCISFQFIVLLMSDFLIQYLNQFKYEIQWCAFALQATNLGCFVVYNVDFLRTNQYKNNIHKFMMLSYFAQIAWFAGLYFSVLYIDRESFTGFMLQADDEPIFVFVHMLYFSSVVSGKIGFGDLFPHGFLCKFLIIVQVYYSSVIMIIVFRGLSFFLKLKGIEEAEGSAQREKRNVLYLE